MSSGGPGPSAAYGLLQSHDEPAFGSVLDAVGVDDGREDARQGQLAGPGRRALERAGERRVAQRSDASADALLEQLDSEGHRVLRIALGEEALDGELQVVELVEAEVEAVGDAAQHHP